METDITALEECKKCTDFLVVGNMFHEGDEGIPHGHVMGIGFANEANRGLGVNGVI